MKETTIIEYVARSYAKNENQDDVASKFFATLVDAMYPTNENLRQWTHDEMMMYYKDELERQIIMRKLKGEDPAEAIIEMIRQRKALES